MYAAAQDYAQFMAQSTPRPVHDAAAALTGASSERGGVSGGPGQSDDRDGEPAEEKKKKKKKVRCLVCKAGSRGDRCGTLISTYFEQDKGKPSKGRSVRDGDDDDDIAG